jgi:hypothetical protein
MLHDSRARISSLITPPDWSWGVFRSASAFTR